MVPDNIPEDMILMLKNCSEWTFEKKKENKFEKETRTLDLEPEEEKTKILQEPKRERWAFEDTGLKRERERMEYMEAELKRERELRRIVFFQLKNYQKSRKIEWLPT